VHLVCGDGLGLGRSGGEVAELERRPSLGTAHAADARDLVLELNKPPGRAQERGLGLIALEDGEGIRIDGVANRWRPERGGGALAGGELGPQLDAGRRHYRGELRKRREAPPSVSGERGTDPIGTALGRPLRGGHGLQARYTQDRCERPAGTRRGAPHGGWTGTCRRLGVLR